MFDTDGFLHPAFLRGCDNLCHGSGSFGITTEFKPRVHEGGIGYKPVHLSHLVVKSPQASSDIAHALDSLLGGHLCILILILLQGYQMLDVSCYLDTVFYNIRIDIVLPLRNSQLQ